MGADRRARAGGARRRSGALGAIHRGAALLVSALYQVGSGIGRIVWRRSSACHSPGAQVPDTLCAVIFGDMGAVSVVFRGDSGGITAYNNGYTPLPHTCPAWYKCLCVVLGGWCWVQAAGGRAGVRCGVGRRRARLISACPKTPPRGGDAGGRWNGTPTGSFPPPCLSSPSPVISFRRARL